jgi:hypothetical protein
MMKRSTVVSYSAMKAEITISTGTADARSMAKLIAA